MQSLAKKVITSVLLLSLMLLVACGADKEQGDTVNKNASQTINIMETSAIPNANPILADNSVSFKAINQIFEGLYRLNKEGKPELALAANEPTVTNDGKTFTFKIKKEANWSDGSPVTAADFEYAWKKVVDPKTAAAYGPQMEEIVKNATPILKGEMDPEKLGVKAIDEKTLEVELENPVPIFKELLTTGTFFPQKEAWVEKQGDRYGTSSETLLSNGPFTLENWDGTKLKWDYVKNPKYWDAKNVKADKIHVAVVKDTNAALNLYNTNKLDRIELDGDFVKQFKTDKNFHTSLTGRSVYMKMNQGKDGIKTDLANENIRRGLAEAVDKAGMVDTLLANGSKPLDGVVPGQIMFSPKDGKDFREINGSLLAYNPEEANTYFKKGLTEIGKKHLTLTLTAGDTSLQKKQSEFIQNQLENNLPGLTVKLKNVPNQVSFKADVTQDFELLLGGWGGDYQDPLTYLNLFLTNSPGNHTGFSNPTYDKLVLGAKGKLSNDLNARYDALLQAEQILLKENAVLIPLYQSGRAYLQNPDLKNYVTYPIGAENYKWMSK
ncbi:solute-binding family 5 protein [Listeria fleischmannii subsp. coloradonensis]|uniref:Peptide ABC transporter substrate-binding protein n=2 Tax=Listeria fleischmannii TaxID=1069827 RepID=A0A841YE03_9LIST|nr:peptide ABC transporter substrate-binding protein [Listeria fleischmannii]EIA19679.1 solute-binding family 5 protein [Listeria fleischmannii subsp. coloradonensis]MBC1398444.1 peptide ABC transporter substrate-binding protein [Listeria fleischmannii]MBC1426505.1 peptide ABC transporter substrate-binding protein [Listeria fleischmannii]STY46581.1 Stage 0 sporulation protein KA [Listeria fleischmannii subsp. coloradonensis]